MKHCSNKNELTTHAEDWKKRKKGAHAQSNVHDWADGSLLLIVSPLSLSRARVFWKICVSNNCLQQLNYASSDDDKQDTTKPRQGNARTMPVGESKRETRFLTWLLRDCTRSSGKRKLNQGSTVVFALPLAAQIERGQLVSVLSRSSETRVTRLHSSNETIEIDWHLRLFPLAMMHEENSITVLFLRQAYHYY